MHWLQNAQELILRDGDTTSKKVSFWENFGFCQKNTKLQGVTKDRLIMLKKRIEFLLKLAEIHVSIRGQLKPKIQSQSIRQQQRDKLFSNMLRGGQIHILIRCLKNKCEYGVTLYLYGFSHIDLVSFLCRNIR